MNEETFSATPFSKEPLKKCTDDGLPESLGTTTVKKEVVVKTGNIINMWKRETVVRQYESICSGLVGVFLSSPKDDTECVTDNTLPLQLVILNCKRHTLRINIDHLCILKH